ncbi:MAG: hypothetical protein ACI93T_001292, partial [Porticoccaceae bacterium]
SCFNLRFQACSIVDYETIFMVSVQELER